MTRADLIAEARRWIGTPFHHQARLRGVGADCIGLLVGAAQACGYGPIDVPTNYPATPVPAMLFAALERSGVVDPIPVEDAVAADVALFAVAGQPTHFGLLTDVGWIHADISYGVVEVPLDDKWRGRMLSAYRVRGLDL